MRALFLATVILTLLGCVEKPKLSCDIFGPVEGKSSPREMLIFPDEIVKAASELRLKLANDDSLAGWSGSVLSSFAGTDAYRFANGLAGLRRLVAYQVAVEQAHENDGPSLVALSDDASCAMLADSIASLDQGLTADQLSRNLGNVRDYFGPAYPYRIEVIEK